MSDDCPADVLASSGTVCRSAAGLCDAAELCTGSSPTCPADAKSTAVCRSAAGTCDVAETCDGTGNTCPTDAFASSGTVCSSTGSCGAPAVCTGTSATCPVSTGSDPDGDGVCGAQDNCPDVANPNQSDGDGDGLGDACDPCTNLHDIHPTKTLIKLTKLTNEPKDGFNFKGVLDGVPITPSINPLSRGGARVILATSPGGAFLDVRVPGPQGWKANKKHTTFTYANSQGFEGIRQDQARAAAEAPGPGEVHGRRQEGRLPESERAPHRGDAGAESAARRQRPVRRDELRVWVLQAQQEGYYRHV